MKDCLKNIPKHPAPYTTPPDYFRDLALKVSQQIEEKEKPCNRKAQKLSLHSRYLLIRNSAVAGIAAACLGFGWFISAETNRLTQSTEQPRTLKLLSSPTIPEAIVEKASLTQTNISKGYRLTSPRRLV